MRQIVKILLYGSLIVGSASCKRFVEIPPSKTQIATATVFSDSSDASAALLGIYIKFMVNNTQPNSIIHGGPTIYTGLASDELVPNGNPYSNFDFDNQFYQNAVLSFNNENSSMWGSAYGAYPQIYQANACIEGVTSSSALSGSLKSQLIGEAKFIRALLYFHLVNLFGDVPLVLQTDFKVNSVMKRTASDTVYQQIINDLKDAQNLLPVTYPSDGRVRPNKYAATALLARIYLYRKQWANAEAAATEVIGSNAYSLEPNLNSVFLAGSKEAILQFLPVSVGNETVEGALFIPATNDVLPSYTINSFLLNAFDLGDQRKANWLGKNTVLVSGVPTDFYYPFKYQHGPDRRSQPLDDYMVLRLAEQYLIRAEARAAQSKITDAIDDLNVTRERAGLPDTTMTDQGRLLATIYHERQVELFCETGHRWYDLKRTGLANTVMTVVTPQKGGRWNSDWQLFPIPLEELHSNPALIQNPGYSN